MLEAEAVLGILSLLERGILELLSSDALVFETEQNPFPLRREHARAVLSKAREHLSLSPEAIQRAKQLTNLGLQPLDALHLALAETGKADYFCTCDDRLLRKSKQIELQVKVVSPVELIQEIEK